MLAKTSRLVTVVYDFKLASFVCKQFVQIYKVIWSTRIMCRAELLFYFVSMYFYCRNKTLQLFFRFQEAKMQRSNHRQTFERPSLGYVYNLRKGSVPSVFRWTIPGTMPSPNNQQMQKELNLSSSFPERVVGKSNCLKYSEQTFMLLEI